MALLKDRDADRILDSRADDMAVSSPMASIRRAELVSLISLRKPA